MASVLVSGSSSPSSSPGWDIATFLGKTLYIHSGSLFPGVSKGTVKLNARANPAMD